MTARRRCGHDWMQHTVSETMPETVGCQQCKTDEPLSASFSSGKGSASKEEIQHLYGSVLSRQNALLHAAHARPGAYYTGNSDIDAKLSELYQMQRQQENKRISGFRRAGWLMMERGTK
jgi:hypothetical protein